MKKIMSLLLAAAMMLAVFAGCGSSSDSAAASTAASEAEAAASTEASTETAEASSDEFIALVTDVGNIDDESFNHTCWEAVVAYGEANGVKTAYYKPTEDSTDARVLSITQAVTEGATVIVMPGYLFGEAIGLTQDQYPDVKFIAVDVGEGDLGDTVLAKNSYSMVFHEEQAGYLAGYAAVKEGYTKLGFLGGMGVPAVMRYGYGYIQGINAAAEELGVDVEIKYTYGGQFYGDATITAKMEGWYSEGTEVVFACGGSIYTSAVEAANKYDGKVIGVDVDQSSIDPCIITSAMKGLYSATYSALETYFSGNWDSVGGTLASLSLTEGDYVGLPTDTWSLTNFTVDEYETVVAGIKDGSITISNSTDELPEVGSHTTLTVVD
jgi:basic membrane protein A